MTEEGIVTRRNPRDLDALRRRVPCGSFKQTKRPAGAARPRPFGCVCPPT